MPVAPNVNVKEDETITIDTYVSDDISNSTTFVNEINDFYNIKFTGFTIDGSNASGKLDISGELQLNGGGGAENSEMSVYVYKSVITTTDLSENTPNFTDKKPVYKMENNLTPYYDGVSFVDVSGNFNNFPINTLLHLYLVSTYSDGITNVINENYTSFTLRESSYSDPSLESITPFGGLVTGGADFTLTGTNLDDVTTVKFGTVNADNFTITTSTTITGKTPVQTDANDGYQLIYINDFSSNDVSFNYYLEASFNELVTAALEKITFPVAPTDTSGVEIVNISNVGGVTSTYETLELSGIIADYFSLLSNYDNSNNDYLAARQTMVNDLFDKAASQYPGANPSLNSIIIDSDDFPFSKAEKEQGMVSNTNKYKLVDYRQQNYTVIDFTYDNKDSDDATTGFFHYMNNNNLSTYVPIPTTDKSEFTFVFNNTILAKYDECSCLLGLLTREDPAITGNIYAKIDVSNGDETTPTYRVRAFFSRSFSIKNVITLDDNKTETSGNFYIITDPGINGNWADIDGKQKYTEDASYNKYDIIEYNGKDVTANATGKVESIVLISSTSTDGAEYREPQEKINMKLNIDIGYEGQKLDLNWDFIMGSLIFGTIKGGITNNTNNTIFNPTELGGGFSGISPKPIVLVERGNQRGMSRMTLRRAGYQDVNSFIANNPGYNTNYIIEGGQAVKNKAFLKQDSSDRTRRLKLKAENLTYNDLTFGGDKNNGSYTARSRARY